jgi:hypothetical protein
MIRLFYLGILVLALVQTTSLLFAQNGKKNTTSCGELEVNFSNPNYLQTNQGMIVVEAPEGWVLDKTHNNPFYFLLDGDTYKSARTLMYINVEALEVPFEQAVQNDITSFKKGCVNADIKDQKRASLLESGCENRTQIFACNRESNSYVDLVTKIDFNGSLLNAVLSGDTTGDISRYRNEYDFLLQHLTMIKSKK